MKVNNIYSERQKLNTIKKAFEQKDWDAFLIVLNDIRERDKDIIDMYRKSHIELLNLKKLKK